VCNSDTLSLLSHTRSIYLQPSILSSPYPGPPGAVFPFLPSRHPLHRRFSRLSLSAFLFLFALRLYITSYVRTVYKENKRTVIRQGKPAMSGFQRKPSRIWRRGEIAYVLTLGGLEWGRKGMWSMVLHGKVVVGSNWPQHVMPLLLWTLFLTHSSFIDELIPT
jgi:hypothetical protein